jgi:hypothetical protein
MLKIPLPFVTIFLNAAAIYLTPQQEALVPLAQHLNHTSISKSKAFLQLVKITEQQEAIVQPAQHPTHIIISKSEALL